jgi:hypothetical protein
MHKAEVLDALKRDVPMNLAVENMPAATSPFAAPVFSTSATDNLFAGTDTPLANVFDSVPATSAMAKTNKSVAHLTRRIEQAKQAVDDLGTVIRNREADLLPARDLADRKAELASLDQQIAAESNLRKLGQLNKARADLSEVIGRQEAVNRDLEALGQKRTQAASLTDEMRIARANLVEAAAAKVPGVSRSETVKRLLGDVSSSRPFGTAVPTRAASEETERALSAPVAEEPKAPKVIPAAQPDEAGKLPAGAADRDTVELGQASGPADLDMPIHMGEFDMDGNPVMTTIRAVLQEHADDEALIKAMNECLVA